jgi:hypothetical protein
VERIWAASAGFAPPTEKPLCSSSARISSSIAPPLVGSSSAVEGPRGRDGKPARWGDQEWKGHGGGFGGEARRGGGNLWGRNGGKDFLHVGWRWKP